MPDDPTNAIVKDRLEQPERLVGFVLDGQSRTLNQLRELDTMLTVSSTQPSAVLV
jgi:adenylate kinase family enzyme